MSTVAQTITIIGGLGGLIGVQTFWISHALDRVDHRIDRVEDSIRSIEKLLIQDHGERIARLEAQHS